MNNTASIRAVRNLATTSALAGTDTEFFTEFRGRQYRLRKPLANELIGTPLWPLADNEQLAVLVVRAGLAHRKGLLVIPAATNSLTLSDEDCVKLVREGHHRVPAGVSIAEG